MGMIPGVLVVGHPVLGFGWACHDEGSKTRAHGIELGFFSWVQNQMNPNVEPGFPEVIL